MKKFEQINVIPFIDIMLVMLAIVLTTATFISTGLIDVDLPQAEHSAPPLNDRSVEITIDATRTYFLDDQSVSLEALSSALETIADDTPIILRVDKAVEFEYFVSVIDLLKKLNLEKLSIVTQGNRVSN